MDGVSNLPDEILCHILSYFTTKEAALTSVLAKRWRYLWALVPKLDVDDSIFLHPEQGKRERDGMLQCCMDFVDHALALQGHSPINKFSLTVKTGIDTDRVDRWIFNVLQRGVTELDIDTDLNHLDFDFDCDLNDEYEVPQRVFVSSRIVKMKLKRELGGFQWGDTFLPVLKTLAIESEFLWCGTLDMFIPSLPVLEELVVAVYYWPKLDVTVSSASLKKLTIYSKGCSQRAYPKSFSFDTPSLLYLEYSDFIAGDYPMVNLADLVEAQLNLLVSDDQISQLRGHYNEVVIHEEDDVFHLLGNSWKLFSGIRNVQKLHLSAGTLEVLFLCSESIPVFNNLKVLYIKSSPYQGWQAMPVLLRNCPRLETLVLQGLLHFETDQCGDACDCITRDYKGRSLLSSPVKKLQIKGFRGTLKESRMIKHFLEFSPCLKEIEVYVGENDPTISESRGMSKLVAQMHKDFLSYHVKFAVYTLV